MENAPIPYNKFWGSSLKIYPHGLSRRKVGKVFSKKNRSSFSVRGSISRFSSHASLRLRRALVEQQPDDLSSFVSLGITLTLPWDVTGCDDLKVARDYKIAFNRFLTAFRRRFPCSCGIFRHELQKRRAPHSHFVLWLSGLDFKYVSRGRSATAGDFRSIVFSLWSAAVSGFEYNYSRLSSFARRGVKVDLLSDRLSAYRYISDHASKHKQSQLGYHGKQWGFVNRKIFVSAPSVTVDFSFADHYTLFHRHISKIARYLYPKKCVFGSHHSRSSDKRSVVFVSRDTALSVFWAVRSGCVCMVKDVSCLTFVRRWWILIFYLNSFSFGDMDIFVNPLFWFVWVDLFSFEVFSPGSVIG